MSHVDDGILHAVLDGALDALAEAGELGDGVTAADVTTHLRTCEDCSARLRAERERRDSAGAVLRAAAPMRSDIPPFEALPQRAPTRRNHWLPLGWAASLVLALGAGWWASGVWRAQPQLASVSDAQVQDAMHVESQAPTSPETVRQGAAAGSAPASAGSLAEPAPQQTTLDARTHATIPDEPAEEAAPQLARTADAQQQSARQSERVEQAAAPEAQPALAPPPPPVATADAAAAARAQGQAVAAAPAARREEDQRVRAASAAVIRMDSAAAAQLNRRGLLNAAAPALPLSAQGAASFAETTFQVTDLTDALVFDSILALDRAGALRYESRSPDELRAMGTAVFVLSEAFAPIVEVASHSRHTVVRVTQTLLSGDVVQLLSWHHAGPGAWQVHATRTLADGRRELLLRSAGGWIVIRGDLAEAELEALVGQLATRR